MRETQVRSPSQEDSLEKGITIYSSILTWRILWTEEPDWLYSPCDCKESDMAEQLTLWLFTFFRSLSVVKIKWHSTGHAPCMLPSTWQVLGQSVVSLFIGHLCSFWPVWCKALGIQRKVRETCGLKTRNLVGKADPQRIIIKQGYKCSPVIWQGILGSRERGTHQTSWRVTAEGKMNRKAGSGDGLPGKSNYMNHGQETVY